MNKEKPIPNLSPKVILEGARMTHKTELALALNEHPRFVGPRKYRYHSPVISSEWGGLQDAAWGQSLINFEKPYEKRALEAFDLWVKLIEHLPHISWIIDRFHLSTRMYQEVYHKRVYDFAKIEERLIRLGFRLIFCYRDPSTYARAREERLKISGNPSQYNNLKMIILEQEKLLELVQKSRFPKLVIDVTDDDVARITEEVVDWMQPAVSERAPDEIPVPGPREIRLLDAAMQPNCEI